MLAVVGLTLTDTAVGGGGVVFCATPAPQPATKNAARSNVQPNHIRLICNHLREGAFIRSIPGQCQYETRNMHCLLDARPVLEQAIAFSRCDYFKIGSTSFDACAPP
jgi:hypothetical protein